MEISVIGISHRTAPVHLREQVSLSADQAASLLRTTRAERICGEALLLSTCNRTEFYFVSPEHAEPLGHLLDHIAHLKGAPRLADTTAFYRHDGLDAVSHLFRVAASLDSQIVGEHEILGQVKTAYRLALDARTARFVLNRLLHRAFRVGKRVRTETDLGRGSASVSQAAVELARQIFSSLTGKTVLLIGAGQTAERAAWALLQSGASRLIVANRTLANAQALARSLLERRYVKGRKPFVQGVGMSCPAVEQSSGECSIGAASSTPEEPGVAARAIGLDDIPSVIAEADLVVASTGAPGLVLTHEDLGRRLGRIDHPLLIVDIAVPRDADPRLDRLPNVFLYNIDDLDRLVAENIGRRRQEIPRAEAIVDWEVQQFRRWLEGLELVPTIKLLQRRFELLREEQIKRYGKQFGATESDALEQFARGLCQRILHQPVAFLREYTSSHSNGESRAAVDLIRRLFDLESLDRDS